MLNRTLALVLVFVTAVAFLPAAQQRVKPKGEGDFAGIVDAAKKDFAGKRYGKTIKSLHDALSIATSKRHDALLAALPAAPASWEVEGGQKTKQAQMANPFAAALTGAVGNVVKQRYRETGGRGTMDVTLTADSPMVQMFNMWLANPAMLGQNAELIEYGAHKALLETTGGKLKLQILMHGAHVCEVMANGMNDEQLFAVFDQAAVDRLANVLAN